MCKSVEQWVGINGYLGLYEVSSKGSIRSLDRVVKGRSYKGRVLKTRYNTSGYPICTLFDGSSKSGVTRAVHNLVAIHFVPNPLPDEYDTVNHKDETPVNNEYTNLEWCTRSYNVKYSYNSGRNVSKFGKDARGFKGAIKVFDLLGNYLYSLHGLKEVTDAGFTYCNVCLVVNGKRKTHKGHIFKR